MKVLYDHQIFSVQKFGGVTRYFSELIKNFPPDSQYFLSSIFSDNHYLKWMKGQFKVIDFLPDKNFKGKTFIKKKLYLINELYSKHCIASNDFDLFHPTFYDNYFLPVLKKPYIVTVHDMIVFKYRDTVYWDSLNKPDRLLSQMKDVIKNSTRIISVSENTKKDLTDILNINEDKIDVIYHGCNVLQGEKKTNSIGRYILFVGRRDSYKNFKIFAESVSRLLIKEKELKLICVGNPFKLDEMNFLNRIGIANQTIAMNISDSNLNDLYSNALVFVFPSLYEGFGMPVLEAFANDCPVCLSNTSSLPEIAGNAGSFFDPNDQESILTAVEKVVYDKAYADELVKLGRIRLKKYSWTNTVRETINSYLKTIN